MAVNSLSSLTATMRISAAGGGLSGPAADADTSGRAPRAPTISAVWGRARLGMVERLNWLQGKTGCAGSKGLGRNAFDGRRQRGRFESP